MIGKWKRRTYAGS